MAERYIEYMPLEVLQRAPRNPKDHDKPAISASLKRFGYVESITLDERTGRLVAGHGRLDELELAASEAEEPPEGITVDGDGQWLVPVQRGWSSKDDVEAEAYVVASNAIGEGLWHRSQLADVLKDLQAGPGLDGVGYDAAKLDELLASLQPPEPVANTDPDEIPPEPVELITRLGDVWLLGPHRMVCGDATDPGAYDAALAGERAALALTDPPYGVGIDYGDVIEDDREHVLELIGGFMPLLLERSERALVTSGHTMQWDYPRPTWMLVWTWSAGVGRCSWGFACSQPVLAYGSDPYLAAGLGCRPDTVTSGGGRHKSEHPVAKPIEVWEKLMERGSIHRGDLVLDPFGGTGTTIIAAHQLGRRAAVIELSPRYVDIACERWQRHTGLAPVLEATGEPADFTAPRVTASS